MTRVLVLDGHPRRESFCAALADRYAESARAAGHAVRVLRIADLHLDLGPPDGATAPARVEEIQAALADCEIWVIVAPMWWGGLPAVVEMLFERVLLAGFAYRWRDGGPWWDGLLVGRAARVILTMDTPPWYLRWVWGGPILRRLRRQVLGFCGFAPVRFTLLGPVRASTPDRRARWLAEIADLGRRAV